MSDSLQQIRQELALANQILCHQNVLDAFGHVSVRHPDDPGRFLMSWSRPPALVRAEDVLEYGLDGEPIGLNDKPLYSERVIHAALYQARPDVQAICHHHAPAIMPFCVAGIELVPVFQLGGVIGTKVPFWDSRDEFGDTNLLVTKMEEAHSLARALAEHWLVLMRRHGATVVGRNVRETVFRAVHSARNAEIQMQAQALGAVDALSPGEMALTSVLRAAPIERCWEHWVAGLGGGG